MCKLRDIVDGASNTYLAGEKYLCPDNYVNGSDQGDDQGWMEGYDYDVNRWTNNDSDHWPRQDQPGGVNYKAFGSAHANGFYMALCDGSVRMFGYAIDPEIHRRLGNRKDGQLIDAKAF
jgi:hypothetical protein